MMMKKSVLAIGVAALLGASAAHAIIVFEDHTTFAARADKATALETVKAGGVGHILVTPYYSAADGNTTLISLVNTDDKMGKAVKVRFRGAANSDDVLDFTVLMSPGDVWTASIESSENGVARIVTPDSSCVLPEAIGRKGVDFRTLRLDPKLSNEARAMHTREGYIEFLNMADISPTQQKDAKGSDAKPVGGTKLSVFANAKHVNNKAPCDEAVAAWLVSDSTLTDPAAYGLFPPTGGLFGNWSVFNNKSVTSYGGGHYAIAAVAAAGEKPAARLIFAPQSQEEVDEKKITTVDEESADPLLRKDALWGASQRYKGEDKSRNQEVGEAVIAMQYLDLPDLSTPYTAADVVGSAFSAKLRAFTLSKALSAKKVMNEFVATADNAPVPFSTDWVFSQPSRRYQVALAYSEVASGEKNMPVNAKPAAGYGTNYFFGTFQDGAKWDVKGNMTLVARSANGVAAGDFLCTKAEIKGSNREEASFSAVGAFSPAPVMGGVHFCGETATLSFNSSTSKVLHGMLANQQVSVKVGSGGSSIVDAGWAWLNLEAAKAVKTDNVAVAGANEAAGLPVVGFSATSFSNGQTNGNFGDAIEHRYER